MSGGNEKNAAETGKSFVKFGADRRRQKIKIQSFIPSDRLAPTPPQRDPRSMTVTSLLLRRPFAASPLVRPFLGRSAWRCFSSTAVEKAHRNIGISAHIDRYVVGTSPLPLLDPQLSQTVLSSINLSISYFVSISSLSSLSYLDHWHTNKTTAQWQDDVDGTHPLLHGTDQRHSRRAR
jgi:hypothetical protein